MMACQQQPGPDPSQGATAHRRGEPAPAGAGQATPGGTRLTALGTAAAGDEQWPRVKPRERSEDALSRILGTYHGVGPLSLAFEFLHFTPAKAADADGSAVLEVGIVTEWPVGGLWIPQRGGQPGLQVTALVRSDGSTVAVSDRCGSVGEPTSERVDQPKPVEPGSDRLRRCAKVRPDGDRFKFVRGVVEGEFAALRHGFRLADPASGDRIEGPAAQVILDSVDDRKITFHVEGDVGTLWDLEALDADGDAIDITMTNIRPERSTLTWRRVPKSLHVEFSALPDGDSRPEGCNEQGRCKRGHSFQLPFALLDEPESKLGSAPRPRADASKPVAFDATNIGSTVDEAWHAKAQAKAAEGRAMAISHTRSGAVILRAAQTGAWIAPWIDVWLPAHPSLNQTWGVVEVEVTRVDVEDDAAKARRRSTGSDWTAPAHISPVAGDANYMLGGARPDLGPAVKLAPSKSPTFKLKRLVGNVVYKLPSSSRSFPIALKAPGVWAESDGVKARVTSITTRDISLEFGGRVQDVTALHLRNRNGETQLGSRFSRRGPCTEPGEGRNRSHLCLRTPRYPVASVEVRASGRRRTVKEPFELVLQ